LRFEQNIGCSANVSRENERGAPRQTEPLQRKGSNPRYRRERDSLTGN